MGHMCVSRMGYVVSNVQSVEWVMWSVEWVVWSVEWVMWSVMYSQ